MLPGGAQIIPEPTPQQLAAVKNEAADLAADDDDDGDDDDDDEQDQQQNDNNFRHPSNAYVGGRKPPEGLSVTSYPALLDIKKENSPMLSEANFGSMPTTSQIKHEALAHLADPTVAGHKLRETAKEFTIIHGLSSLSESDSADGEQPSMTMHKIGPGGTLQIPGVPAAITALPRSPLPLQKPLNLPNSLTVTAIDPLPSSPPKKQTQRKPRKTRKQPPPLIDSSDEEEGEYNSSSASGGNNISPSSKHKVLLETAGTIGKKGPGRPRKNTPSQSGNLSSASSTAKGPTLTAKKDVAKKPTTARRRLSRQTSSSSAQGTPTITPKKLTPKLPANSGTTQQLLASSSALPAAVAKTPQAVSSEDSSSSSTTSCSTSKSSSSSSDSEEEVTPAAAAAASSKPPASSLNKLPPSTALSASTPAVQAAKRHRRQSKVANSKPAAAGRIVKQLNKRKTSLDVETAPPAVAFTKKTKSNEQKSSQKVSTILSSSGSSNDSDSADEYVNAGTHHGAALETAADSQNALAAAPTGSHSQRSQNQQSPYKAAASSRSRVSSSSSSASSSSASSSGEHSDSDCESGRKDKVSQKT